MNFIIARDIKYDTFIMCNDNGTNTVTIDKEQLINMKQKIYEFNINNLAVYNGDTLLKNSITLLGKYYYNKNKDIKYLICDGKLQRASVHKEELIRLANKIGLTNAKIQSDGKIRMIKGSIPFLNNLNTLRNTNTVIKIGNIKEGTPGSIGVSKKILGKRITDGRIGCVKLALFDGSFDLNNEVLAFELGKLLRYDVAEATFEVYNKSRCIISIYNYNTGKEYIKSLKSEIGIDNFHNRFNKKWFIQNKSESAWNKFLQMVILDLIMHQTDRHISNIAFKNNDLYSLYDNGRALFYDNFQVDTAHINLNNRGSIVESFYTNEHGYGWMFLEDVLGYDNYKHLIRHDLQYVDFLNIVNKCYGDKDTKRNEWVTEYMYKVYLIITKQERNLKK